MHTWHSCASFFPLKLKTTDNKWHLNPPQESATSCYRETQKRRYGCGGACVSTSDQLYLENRLKDSIPAHIYSRFSLWNHSPWHVRNMFLSVWKDGPLTTKESRHHWLILSEYSCVGIFLSGARSVYRRATRVRMNKQWLVKLFNLAGQM